jgi:hypothetical protein
MKNLSICFISLLLAGYGCSDGGVSSDSTNTLYLVSNTTLRAYDVTNSKNPTPAKELKIGFGIETIFPYRGNLFMGTQTGMLIYDATREGDPRYLSTYSHIVSCDPVVVQGTLAYVTLRSGTGCRNTVASNVLEIIDVSNLTAPRVLKSISMINPRGLGVDGNRLFVCEGDSGLKMFDLTNPTDPQLLQYIKDVRSYDLIPSRDLLIVTGKDGIYQYSYADRKELKLLSKLTIEPIL